MPNFEAIVDKPLLHNVIKSEESSQGQLGGGVAPTETERNTAKASEALPPYEAQAMPPSEIALQADCASLSAAPASGGGRGLRGPDGVTCFQSTLTI